MITIEEFLKLGLSKIVRISKWEESPSGRYDGEGSVNVACFHDGEYKTLRVSKTSFMRCGRIEVSIYNEKIIDEDDYEELADEFGGIFDTPEVMEIHNSKKKQISSLKRRTPTCPDCEIKMEMRFGEYGHFWGCLNFPDCRYTIKLYSNKRNIIEAIKENIAYYERLMEPITKRFYGISD